MCGCKVFSKVLTSLPASLQLYNHTMGGGKMARSCLTLETYQALRHDTPSDDELLMVCQRVVK